MFRYSLIKLTLLFVIVTSCVPKGNCDFAGRVVSFNVQKADTTQRIVASRFNMFRVEEYEIQYEIHPRIVKLELVCLSKQQNVYHKLITVQSDTYEPRIDDYINMSCESGEMYINGTPL